MHALHRTLPALALLAAACVLLLLPGCVKYKQTLTVQPDGSGKMDLVMGMSSVRLAELPEGSDPFAALSIESLRDNPQGFVAFTEPRPEDRDGFRVVTVTGYFDDVSQLGFAGGLGAGAEGLDAVAYGLEPGVLTVRRPLFGQAAAAFTQQDMDLSDAELRRVLVPAVAGLELEDAFVLPGRVTEAGPLEVDGRTASAGVRGAAALDGYDGLMSRYGGVDTLRIRFEPTAWAAPAKAAWQQELADAKKAWARRTGDAE